MTRSELVQSMQRYSYFFAAIIFVCVFPLMPIFIEIFLFSKIESSSLIISSVMYSITAALLLRDVLIFAISFLYSCMGCVTYVHYLLVQPTTASTNLGMLEFAGIELHFLSTFFILVFFSVMAVRLFIDHIVKRLPFQVQAMDAGND